MKRLQLTQGSPEWHAHRASHHNASDAPAMLGISPYKTRAALIREKATGVTPDIDAATQRIFDDGHKFEALARPLAEEIVGEDLYPVVGVPNDGKISPLLSASFDGLTLMGDVAFEHKTLNDTLRDAMQDGCTGADLPEHYRAQMEQQLVVSGAKRVLFMASKWGGDNKLIEERHCWYEHDVIMRARLAVGWDQFAADVAAYDPATDDHAPPPVTGASPDALPSLHVEASGRVIASNLDAYRDHAMQVLGSINRDLQTDQDFADAEQTVKWCKSVEDKLAAAKDSVLGQMTTVDEVCRTIDDLSAETRRVRLDLDKMVKAEKESRKREIVTHYVELVRKHYASMAVSMGEHAIGVPATLQSDIAGAIKGLKTLGSITDAADTKAANLKIEASQQADRIRAAMAVLDEFAEHNHLFADRVQLCATKAPDDLRNLAKARIAEHEEQERQRIEAERERIRAEEQAKAERKAQIKAEAAEAERADIAAFRAEHDAATVPQMQSVDRVPPATDTTAPTGVYIGCAPQRDERLIKLGDINDALSPLSINAAGLAQIGIKPAESSGRAKMYRVADVMRALSMLRTMLLNQAPERIQVCAKEAA